MEFEKLHHLKSRYPLVKIVLDRYSCDLSESVKDDDRTEELKKELMKLYTENFNVTYSEWQKRNLSNCAAPVSTKVTLTHTIQKFLKKFISEVDTLASHIHRIREQFRAAKMSKEEAKVEDVIATIQLDWRAFYFEQHVALQIGYVWLKDGSFSFGCLSDDTNHMAEAAWAGIQPLLNHLVDEKEISIINIISDSPISQYRNKTMFYLIKKFAAKQKIKIKWIYFEAGHGKGVADSIGATLKRKMDEAINYNPDDSFSSVSDLIDAIEDRTDIKLYLYGKSDVEKVKLPKLSTIKGTVTLHEVVATSDGKFYGKDLSSDKESLLAVKF
ncbi:unnamed protein product [Didymodactylos carnosus]|uniref:Uncharacterized protein n=1 Tax=Didymodactylos carnosus TaxID=1234261 RepID=A0A814NLX7_9BILA|nr:unnamed protein product [Didymodactylos carnosus]CAF1093445.1 unnamed protein product [Didymodactylos carnosus]CAF3854961.1 unnamed protein product [Didymodactylos carnosus]CAF3858601.1 unnamed protein product [Didymodactylos carnosus]